MKCFNQFTPNDDDGKHSALPVELIVRDHTVYVISDVLLET